MTEASSPTTPDCSVPEGAAATDTSCGPVPVGTEEVSENDSGVSASVDGSPVEEKDPGYQQSNIPPSAPASPPPETEEPPLPSVDATEDTESQEAEDGESSSPPMDEHTGSPHPTPLGEDRDDIKLHHFTPSARHFVCDDFCRHTHHLVRRVPLVLLRR